MLNVNHKCLILLILLTPFMVAADSVEPPPEEESEHDRGSVRGGVYDKPFMFSAGGTRFGGYADLQFRGEREEGFRSDASFLVKRLNIFAFAPIGDRVRLAVELEFEDAAQEIALELAILDFEIHPALIARVGMILSPIGKFNLAHDSPAHHHVDRPLVSTQIIPSTLSEPGAGFYGAFTPWEEGVLSYEIYAVNGLGDGILTAGEGTRMQSGKGNFEDNNGIPSVVSRLALQPVAGVEVGISGHGGLYNTSRQEDLVVDESRVVAIGAVDAEWRVGDFELRGEFARVHVDIPESVGDGFASAQQGYYGEAAWQFLDGVFTQLPEAHFLVSLRHDWVDMDVERVGEYTHMGTLGLGFRPIDDAIFKLDYRRGLSVDRFSNPLHQASILFGGAAYF